MHEDRGDIGVGRSTAPHAMYPNFDYIRLIAATTVIFSHAFVIADGNKDSEPFVKLLGKGNMLGIFGVFVFFCVSGFLVAQSGETSRSWLTYSIKRALRILPALVMCFIITAFVIGPAFSSIGALPYLTSRIPFAYVYHALRSIDGSYLSTVQFYYPASMGSIMNGSIWTIPQEIACYGVVVALFAIPSARLPLTMAAFAIAQLVILFQLDTIYRTSVLLGNFGLVVPSFLMGVLLWQWLGGQHDWPTWPLLPCAAIAAYAYSFWQTLNLFPLFGVYPILWVATSSRVKLPPLRRLGDISYGLYLYGWPIEQLCRHWVGDGARWWQVFLPALALSAAAGWLSWHLIERPALRLKRFELGRWGAALDRLGRSATREHPLQPLP